jgi:hypothetical protein
MMVGTPMPCLYQLTNFTCKACGLTGTLPSSWLSVQLQQLVLPDNLLSGPLFWVKPGFEPQPCQLQVLDLARNQLDQVPDAAFWSRVGGRLERLYLQGNKFALTPLSGKHVSTRHHHLSDLSHCQSDPGVLLQPMHAISTKQTDCDTICLAVGLLLDSIAFVDVSRNSFKGTLPPAWLKSPSKLEFLNAGHNQLTGTIPRRSFLHA